MLDLGNDHCTAQNRGRVGFTPPGCHSVAKHAASERTAPPCGFILAPCLDTLKRGQNIHRLKVGDRKGSYGLQLLQQPVHLANRGIGAAFCDHLVDIFLGDVTKTVRSIESGCQLFALPRHQGIDPAFKLPSGFVSSPPRFRQADIGIASKSKALLLGCVPIFVSPQF